MLPVISKWELEQSSVCAPVKMQDGCEVASAFLSTMVIYFEQEGVPVHQVSVSLPGNTHLMGWV